MKTKDRISKI